MPERSSRIRAQLIVLSAYVLATFAAGVMLHFIPSLHPITRVAIADTVATAVVFAFSRAFENSSVYDPYWSVAPMVIAAYLVFGLNGEAGISVRKWLALLVVFVWGARLTFNWIRGWKGFHQEDWRYLQFKPKWGAFYWPLSFLGIHFFPTVCTFLGCLPLFVITISERPVGWLDLLGAGIALAGTLIEGTGDEQLRAFREDPANKGGICDVGLWHYSRHPNYFGECTFWLGLWVMGYAAAPEAAAWTAIGVVVIVALFVFYSIPAAEKRSLERRADYAEHQKHVSAFVPWFRK
ncbi:MAG: DUF1295 domain-containing protein [Polyangiaceae bacterium]|nr:DUF1295 domain-containing protein [Polyangiaceae bacterium]